MMSDHHEFESPVDLPTGEPLRHPLRWTTSIMVIASLFLLATNAISLREWVDEQAPGPRQAQLAALAERWDALTLSIGLGVPRAALHREWKAAEAARFGNQPADQR
jgi:hypothetical protein